MSAARMPAGWQGVRRAADEWVRFALHDATGQASAVSFATPLVRLAGEYEIPIEDLVEWVYMARNPRDLEAWLDWCEWQREKRLEREAAP